MRKKSEAESRVERIVEPVLENLGFELVDLEYKREAGGKVLRIFIDSPDGIDLDDCAEASNALSEALDVEDPIPDAYNLEVSSPGIERALTKVSHFKRFVGERVRVKTYESIEGRRDFTGLLTDAGDDAIEVEIDGHPYRIEYDKVAKATLKPVIEFK